MPELRKDPIVGRWVIIATERARRPIDFQIPHDSPHPGLCPFCPGQEDKTPPEVLAYRPPDGPAARRDVPGWSVRAVPNKFPALMIEGDGQVFFAPEICLTLLAGDAPDRYYRVPGRDLSDRRLASQGESEGPLELVNDWDKFLVRVRTEPATPLWRHPLETASQSEGGFERTYQASVVVPVWRDVVVGDGQPFECKVAIEMVPIA